MNDKPPEYKIFAIKYASREARRSDHFIGGDPHDGPMPMDYFTWAVVGPEQVFLVDTGLQRQTQVLSKDERKLVRSQKPRPIEAR
jgi:hypothetical protein